MTRLGSGSDSSKFNIQLSLATLSVRAAKEEQIIALCVVAAHYVNKALISCLNGSSNQLEALWCVLLMPPAKLG